MYKILIVDDEVISRENTKTALIGVQDNISLQDERLVLAEKHFAVTPHQIVGAAIQYVNENPINMPDLALLDVSFAELHDDDVEEKGFKPDVEITTTRGLDMYDILKDHTQTILFTARAGVHDTIGEEFFKRRINNYISIVSKIHGINIFSNAIKVNLEIVAYQLIAKANDRNLNEVLPLLQNIENPNILAILAARIWLDGREFTIQNFFIFKFSLAKNGKDFIPDDDFFAYIVDFFADFATPAMPELKGVWKKEWVHQVFLEWRNSPNYTAINNEINNSAANCILEFLNVNHTNTIIMRNRGIINTTTLGNGIRHYGQAPWTASFINALIVRRAFIGLSRLADETIWSIGINQRKRNIIDFIMESVGWTNNDYNNVRFHFNTKLGLSILEYHADLQRLNTAEIYLLVEEQDFIATYFHQITARMKNLNQYQQPAPDYTEF